jgi:hypothetical protein
MLKGLLGTELFKKAAESRAFSLNYISVYEFNAVDITDPILGSMNLCLFYKSSS